MITEQYVTFETAKLLDEAGFREPSRGIYCINRKGDYDFREYDLKQVADDLMYNIEDGFQYEYLSPTQALAARWLRGVHNLHVWCEITQYGDWFYCIDKIKPYEQYAYVSEADFNCFENALEAGLQEALKRIIKNKEQ